MAGRSGEMSQVVKWSRMGGGLCVVMDGAAVRLELHIQWAHVSWEAMHARHLPREQG